MLTCVCRPVSGNLPKMPPSVRPITKQQQQQQQRSLLSNNNNNNNNIILNNNNNNNIINNNNNNNNNIYNNNNHMVVVTAEPKLKVPGRLTSAELRAMALRQQQQIDSQHQLLATKEQRLRFLKQQEVRNAVANAEGERLRRLRERVEAQESKLRRLRALRGQVDLQKTYNVTLSNDLDSIRALFSEKEKELSLAVAKVEALTRQLEDLRRDRRCPINLINGGSTTGQPLPPQASRELEKLRRELMYRNQLSLQQDARLHLQREALQQRQAELRSVDQRIYELQTRLQRKKAANVQNNQQNMSPPHIMQQQQATQQQTQHQQQQNVQQQQQQQQQQQKQQQQPLSSQNSNDMNYATNVAPKTGVAALKQQLLQKQANQAAAAAAVANGQAYSNSNKFANIITRSENRNLGRGNVAAVEPYIHTPQKSTITPTASYLGNILKHAAATANTNQQNQLIQDHAHVKLNLTHSNANTNHLSATNPNTSPNFFTAESDESKLAKKMLTAAITNKTALHEHNNQNQTHGGSEPPAPKVDTSHHIYAEVGPKKRDLVKEVAANLEHQSSTNNTNIAPQSTTSSKIPKSISANTSASALINKLNSVATGSSHIPQREKSDLEKKPEIAVTSETLMEKNAHQLTVHSMPLGAANKSVATAITTNSTTNNTSSNTTNSNENTGKIKAAGSLVVPPRKPISSVAPTSVTSAIPKMITYSPKVNRVAPSVVSSAATAATASAVNSSNNNDRPALPPKPHKMTTNEGSQQETSAPANAAKKSAAETPNTASSSSNNTSPSLAIQNINDNLPIKAKPLTIRKQPLSEQPRLKSSSSNNNSSTITKPSSSQPQSSRKHEQNAGSNYLFNDRRTPSNANNNNNNNNSELSSETNSEANSTPQYSPNSQTQTLQQQQQQLSPNTLSPQSQSSVDEPDRIANTNDPPPDKPSVDTLKRRMRSLSAGNNASSSNAANGKPKLTRRVSFDPLALLLDASLEGELELVKKTAMQVANPSAANDEGITALHNAICAGHIDIVKFLVEFGCDVNAQDSDGWTPLHCAASCNNLAMVKFLVENGACLFAATLSDHETPAEKCEEDEEGFDGCSEYLYSIQEKLGILHNGEVYAVFSYEAQNSDELTFNVNERLIILRKGDDAESEWWWAKNEQNEEGYVPRNLLGLYPRVPPQTTNYAD